MLRTRTLLNVRPEAWFRQRCGGPPGYLKRVLKDSYVPHFAHSNVRKSWSGSPDGSICFSVIAVPHIGHLGRYGCIALIWLGSGTRDPRRGSRSGQHGFRGKPCRAWYLAVLLGEMRLFALECLRWSKETGNPSHRDVMVRLAKTWISTASAIEHPIANAKSWRFRICARNWIRHATAARPCHYCPRASLTRLAGSVAPASRACRRTRQDQGIYTKACPAA